MNIKSPDVVLRRPICTWLSHADYAKVEAIAKSHGITVSAYLRAIVVDAIVDDVKTACVPERQHAVAG